MSYQQVTLIDDLPELEDIVGYSQSQYGSQSRYGGLMVQGSHHEQVQRAIRQTNRSNMYPESGMGAPQQQNPNHLQAAQLPPPEKHISPVEHSESFEPPEVREQPPQSSGSGPSCLHVADHIEHCPICSKLYRQDNTLLLIVIVVLAIINIILLKKVLDV